jgi:hypothetical protein
MTPVDCQRRKRPGEPKASLLGSEEIQPVTISLANCRLCSEGRFLCRHEMPGRTLGMRIC